MTLFLCGRGPAIENILRKLVANKGNKIAVFTHDNAPLIALAQSLGVPVTTADVNDIAAWPFHPAAIASIGYLTIFKQPTIDAVHGRIINGHAALLPNHAGRSAVPWAIIDGDQLTGITYHWVDAGIDTGNILLQATCPIAPEETQSSLFAKVHYLLEEYFDAALKLAMVDWPGVPQFGARQYHKAGPPHDGAIDAMWDDAKVERFIRAMTYPPMPYATIDGIEVRTMAEFRRALIATMQVKA